MARAHARPVRGRRARAGRHAAPARMRLELRLEASDDPLRAGGRIIRAPSPSLRVVLFEQLSPGAADLVAREVREAREREAG